jgi:hypothetical protein
MPRLLAPAMMCCSICYQPARILNELTREEIDAGVMCEECEDECENAKVAELLTEQSKCKEGNL